jgi:hypothetical protein
LFFIDYILYLQRSFTFQVKFLGLIIVKYFGLRLSCVILRPVTNKLQFVDKFP